MFLISSHILDCNEIKLPDNAVVRVNLAWIDSIERVYEKLNQIPYEIFLDNPVDRVKPPANKYSMDQILSLIDQFPNIKYLAVSNVKHGYELAVCNNVIPDHVNVIPKIETIEGVYHIAHIAMITCVRNSKSYIMLDHDDLCSDLIRNNIDPSLMYVDYIDPLISFCVANKINLLRTQGVIFSTVN